MRPVLRLVVCLVSVASCADLDPTSVTRCRNDVDCIGASTCRAGTCRGPNEAPDAFDGGSSFADASDVAADADAEPFDSGVGFADARVRPDSGLNGCVPEVVEGLRCTTVNDFDCAFVADQDVETGVRISCALTPEAIGCTPEGEIANVDFRFFLPAPTTIRGVRFLSDWFAKRPANYQVWAAADGPAIPGTPGAVLVGQAEGFVAPWRCVNDSACDFFTPTVCCPNGRDQPVETSTVFLRAKYDFTALPPVKARYWTIRFLDSEEGSELLMQDVEFLRSICVRTL